MRLNGSMRLGIVMSAVWMVLTTTFLWLQDSKRVDAYAKALSIEQARCKLENTERRSSKRPEQACVSDQDIRGAYSSGKPVYAQTIIAVGLLVAAWIVVRATWAVVSWIRRNFS